MARRSPHWISLTLSAVLLLGLVPWALGEDVILQVTPAEAVEAQPAEAPAPEEAPAAVVIEVVPVETAEAAPEAAPEAEPAPAPEAEAVAAAEAEPAPEAEVVPPPEPQPLTGPWSRQTPPADEANHARNAAERINVDNVAREKLEVAEGTYRFYVPMVTGDRDKVEKLQLWRDWAEYITFNAVTAEEISAFRESLLKNLQEAGYVFASVEFPTAPWQQGFFVALVDCGPLGDITVRNQGRHYTQQQIINKLSNRDNRFNYADVRNQLADLNNGGDIKLDTTLKPTRRNGRIYVDAEVEYEDTLPIHGALELTNTTSREADSDVRVRATLQHTNLTKHDDVLTLGYITDGDLFDSTNAVYGSYQLPLDDKWSVGLYGSWSDSDYANVIPDTDISGRGYTFGFQVERELYADAFRRLTATAGWKMARTKNRMNVFGYNLDLTTAVVSMPYLTLGYSSQVYDNYNGRNFATLTLTGNRADKWGASKKETFVEESWSADGTFFQARFAAARVQRLFEGEDHPGRWTLFARTQAVYSDDTLPNSCREYLGGYDTIRGYNESELAGDNMFSATVELRTPLLENFLPGLEQTKEEMAEEPNPWKLHRLQGVVFTDYGYISSRDYVNDGSNGRNSSQSLLSVGVGIRLGISRYAQAAADYGLALIKHASEDTPNRGRFHLSLQLQF
ncbi:MAG: ShlB/FhaC/HecB family hemolysin secretion/activation protein [Oligosphaeraceae bacterium]